MNPNTMKFLIKIALIKIASTCGRGVAFLSWEDFELPAGGVRP